MRKYRVIQWATGHVGKHALRAIAQHPELELVGVWVSSPNKVGRDAGELSGIGPTGVKATNEMEALVATEADCVCYTGATDYRPTEAIEDMCRLLASGKNVVTSSFVPLIYPWQVIPAFAEQLEEACRRGQTSFYCSGIDPGFSPDALPITLSSLCERIDSIRSQEIFNYATYDQPQTLFDVMGFGKPPGTAVPLLAPGALSMAWGASVRMVADALAVKLDGIEQRHEVEVAPEDFDISCGTIRKGTVAALRFEVMGMVGGKPRIVVEHITRLRDDLAPHWPRGVGPGTYRVTIEGMPSLRCDLQVGFHSADHNIDGCVATAMRLVNAIPALCQASPGVKTYLDLPLTPGRYALR
ncbi:MAG: diacylglycerol kinase [candidate division KSB1 bacterium]|nr:diacylglycerol kinase [candidate division KSB1 bacterium]